MSSRTRYGTTAYVHPRKMHSSFSRNGFMGGILFLNLSLIVLFGGCKKCKRHDDDCYSDSAFYDTGFDDDFEDDNFGGGDGGGFDGGGFDGGDSGGNAFEDDFDDFDDFDF